jgi:hypothetical protein
MAVSGIESASIAEVKYPEVMSTVVNTAEPPKELRRSSIHGMGICGITVWLFSFLKFTVMRAVPSGFSTATTGEAHGDKLGRMIPAARSLSNSVLIRAVMAGEYR